ncbi:MAG: hypothetical protein IK015_07365 [Treponema sp.]|nr:hypothetical protein [Treponema sp.]
MKIGNLPEVSKEGIYVHVPTADSLTSEQECIKWASLTNDYRYYMRLSLLRNKETKAAREEIMRKYPYDGKSTFAELLAEGIRNGE